MSLYHLTNPDSDEGCCGVFESFQETLPVIGGLVLGNEQFKLAPSNAIFIPIQVVSGVSLVDIISGGKFAYYNSKFGLGCLIQHFLNLEPVALYVSTPILSERITTLKSVAKLLLQVREQGGIHWLMFYAGDIPMPEWKSFFAAKRPSTKFFKHSQIGIQMVTPHNSVRKRIPERQKFYCTPLNLP